MTIEHVDITDPYLHEPKGIAAATQSKVYVSDGAGSGAWQKVSPTEISSTGKDLGRILTSDGSNGASWDATVWKEIVGQVIVRGSGANDPAWELITGSTAMFGYSYSAATMQQHWNMFHIDHDYKAGTPVYAHVHWLNAAAAPNTGNVRWGFEYAIAKGHQQQAFPFTATTTVYVVQASSATRYMHHIAEISLTDAIPATDLEPDSIIHMRIFRDAANVLDTCTDNVYCSFSDIHYQANAVGTMNKAPNFYV